MLARILLRASCFTAISMLVLAVAFPRTAMAQDGDGAGAVVSEETTETTTVTETTDKPLRGPKYLNLRYDEDFSYLDGPDGSYEEDIFDPIKWIHITDDLTLTLGGEFRARLESWTHRSLGTAATTQDTYFLHRYRVHADLRYRKLARLYWEGMSAFVEDMDLPTPGIHENRWEALHQLFVDFRVLGEDVPLTLRVGRQEFQFGAQRVLSPLGWANTRRKFDGVAMIYNAEKFDITAWWAKPVPVNRVEGYNRTPDRYREEQDVYGIYAECKAIEDHFFDMYFMATHDTGDLSNSNFRRGDMSMYTIGGRAGGKTGPFDYEGELAGQWGTFAGDRIQAWMGAVDGGYTFADASWKPRIGVGFDWGSGDDDPTDRTHGTFNQIYPLSHKYLGFMDFFARQNVLATNVNLTLKPCKKVTTRLAWHTFWNDSTRDSMYNAGGVPGRRDVAGHSGHDIGNELDLIIKYKIDLHQNVLFGYSHFWGNNFVRSTGPSEDGDFIYLQYAYTF